MIYIHTGPRDYSRVKPTAMKFLSKPDGITFRSRVEAKWALFFDRMLIDWTYESKTVSTRHGLYLPDFLVVHPLEGHMVDIEIKGGYPLQSEIDKCLDLCSTTQQQTLLVSSPIFDPLDNQILSFLPGSDVPVRHNSFCSAISLPQDDAAHRAISYVLFHRFS